MPRKVDINGSQSSFTTSTLEVLLINWLSASLLSLVIAATIYAIVFGRATFARVEWFVVSSRCRLVSVPHHAQTVITVPRYWPFGPSCAKLWLLSVLSRRHPLIGNRSRSIHRSSFPSTTQLQSIEVRDKHSSCAWWSPPDRPPPFGWRQRGSEGMHAKSRHALLYVSRRFLPFLCLIICNGSSSGNDRAGETDPSEASECHQISQAL